MSLSDRKPGLAWHKMMAHMSSCLLKYIQANSLKSLDKKGTAGTPGQTYLIITSIPSVATGKNLCWRNQGHGHTKEDLISLILLSWLCTGNSNTTNTHPQGRSDLPGGLCYLPRGIVFCPWAWTWTWSMSPKWKQELGWGWTQAEDGANEAELL